MLAEWQESLRHNKYLEHKDEYGDDVANALSHCWGMYILLNFN